jgi:HAD superfamily hydrolase (TIGR01509 family)
MEELVRKLRKNYRVIVFSGNIRERIEYLDKKYGLYDKFDELVFSFDTGLSKREMKMYDILLERINCKPQECVCIDDSEGVLEIEKSLGMKTILFKDAEQLKEELRKLGVNIYA